jgi:hypothetical protein
VLSDGSSEDIDMIKIQEYKNELAMCNIHTKKMNREIVEVLLPKLV